ncbi:formate--tetrahydrofolate ligase [uncultured Helcococcus sp.]|uniref:formate--tetrahydrofolate ligase n=1 Tax=uncultured Helcococcus sp. TaxID=1072508 RepID=UPI00288BD24C|nr:formate--tetrahydrofolate ligase [uncultured Helcococcus sp.]
MKSDYEISRLAKKLKIKDVASKINLKEEDIILYGDYKAKINKSSYESDDGNLILVTSINPTKAGEGKSTITIGLSDALNKLGKKSIVALREPSLGPVLGRKGGATGGGYAQIVPMEDINLHFTGDFHAITSAHNAIMALINNHIFFGNELGFDQVEFNYVMDMNERALRSIDIYVGKDNERASSFDISVASELMAIVCLATDYKDLKNRISNILIGYKKDNTPIFVKDLGAEGVVTALLKDAFKPNLVQTLENNPAIVHGGPFANIAHGCNSVIASKTALSLGEYVVTEAGFGADLGGEKFINIKSRISGLKPKLAIVVATIKAIKLHGGQDEESLTEENLAALEKGIKNLEKHVENMRSFNLPVIVDLNLYKNDSEKEIDFMESWAKDKNVEFSLTEVWSKGGQGAIDLAEKSIDLIKNNNNDIKYIYENEDDLDLKIEKLAKAIYGADGVDYSDKALDKLKDIKSSSFSKLPICVAKTEKSLSDNPMLKGRPKNFNVLVQDLKVKSGAGFIVVYLNKVLTMPGLNNKPNALEIDLDEDNNIKNIF